MLTAVVCAVDAIDAAGRRVLGAAALRARRTLPRPRAALGPARPHFGAGRCVRSLRARGARLGHEDCDGVAGVAREDDVLVLALVAHD